MARMSRQFPSFPMVIRVEIEVAIPSTLETCWPNAIINHHGTSNQKRHELQKICVKSWWKLVKVKMCLGRRGFVLKPFAQSLNTRKTYGRIGRWNLNTGGASWASKEPAWWAFSYCSKCLGVKQPDKVVLRVSQIYQCIGAILCKGKPLAKHKHFSPIWSVIKLLVKRWWSFFWRILMFAISTSGWQQFLVKYYEWYL